MKARLVTWPDPTGTRHLVGDVELPPFVKVPDVLQWGNRTFARDPRLGDVLAPAGVYVEAFCYAIPDLSAVTLPPARTDAAKDGIVHALRAGVAVCGHPGVPGTWPPGHSWVYADHGEDRPDVTCVGCRVRLG